MVDLWRCSSVVPEVRFLKCVSCQPWLVTCQLSVIITPSPPKPINGNCQLWSMHCQLSAMVPLPDMLVFSCRLLLVSGGPSLSPNQQLKNKEN